MFKKMAQVGVGTGRARRETQRLVVVSRKPQNGGEARHIVRFAQVEVLWPVDAEACTPALGSSTRGYLQGKGKSRRQIDMTLEIGAERQRGRREDENRRSRQHII